MDINDGDDNQNNDADDNQNDIQVQNGQVKENFEALLLRLKDGLSDKDSSLNLSDSTNYQTNDDNSSLIDKTMLLCNNNEDIQKIEITSNDILVILQEFQNINNTYKILKETLDKKVESITFKHQENLQQKDELFHEKLLKLKEDKDILHRKMKELLEVKEKDLLSKVELNNALTKTIERLEDEIKQHKLSANEANEKLTAHDAAAKRAIAVIKKEMGTRFDQVTKLHDEALLEKDALVIKISKLEALIEELQKNQGVQTKKSSDQSVELDRVASALRTKEGELVKASTSIESLEKELNKHKDIIKKHKEELDAQEMKVKWSQNKLKSELDSHKESKKQIAQLNVKLQEAKEERDQIQKNCQEMIARYQGDEEIESVRLNKEVTIYESKIKEYSSNIEDLNKILQAKDDEITRMKEDKLILEEKLTISEKKIVDKEDAHSKVNGILDEQVKDNAELKSQIDKLKVKVEELEECKDTLAKKESYIDDLQAKIDTLNKQLEDANNELKEEQQRQMETLQFSRNLTESNAESNSMITDLKTKLDEVLRDKEELSNKSSTMEKKFKSHIETLEKDKKVISLQVEDLTSQIEQKNNVVNELSSSLDEAKNELKVYKKKSASQLKDLQKQLQQSSKKLNHFESNGSVENLSIRSRTSSCNSLERIHDSPPGTSPQMQHDPIMIPQDHYISQPNRSNPNSFNEIEVDKKVLVERICKLQRSLARKSEKMEFMQEHVHQLTEDVQKKAKIIQFYVSKEETGSMSSNRFDENKADLSQHGGIMASVYSAKPTDKKMTLELSLTINKQLQAVLEDTLLKNMMLKENINTLGTEIAKLQDQLKP